MTLPSPSAAQATPQMTTTPHSLGIPPRVGSRAGRGVLDGAFAILEVLSCARNGMGLTDMAHATGLAKTSAHRLADQLIAVGAVQRVDNRYFIGPMIGRLGHCWQPDPLLRRVCEEPIRRLSTLTGATASAYVLHLQRARLVTASVPVGRSWVPPCEFDAATTSRTAIGRILLAADPHAARPAGIPPAKWDSWRAGIRGARFVITESDTAPEGCCSAAVPIWRANGDCAGAAAVIARAPALSRATFDLLFQTAQRIGQALRL